MKRLYVLIAVLALSIGCASLPVKQKAVDSLQTTETILEQAQSIERQLCNPTLAAQTPPVPITTCTGPTATTIQLTDAKHQQIAAALSTAFGLQIKATTALQAWRSGDPPPADLVALQADVKEALGVVTGLVQGPQNGNLSALISKIQNVLDTLTNTLNSLKGAK